MTDEAQIRQVIDTWIQASTEGDLVTLGRLMHEDVVFLRPGLPVMRGREAFLSAFRSMAGRIRLDAHPAIQEIQVAGDLAFVWNFLSMTVAPLPAGEPKKSAGPILTIFLWEPDGRWVLYRDANMLTSISSDA